MTQRSRFAKIVRNTVIAIAGVLFVVLVAIFVMARVAFNTEGELMGALHKTVISKDGTTIAYEQTGSGAVLILVSAALTDCSGNRRLARELSRDFTVINYDRRSRGASNDTPPYAIDREIEDISALVDASGGSAYLFGSSSGSVLALDAASHLGGKVKKLYMYEPPFIVDSTRPPVPANLASEIQKQVVTGNRRGAVKMFFTEGMGIPSFAVTLMRFFMPGWSKMCGIAHTIPYDLQILDGTQSGKTLPERRWTGVTAPIRVAVGGKSEPFFHDGAKALASMMPSTRYQSLAGLNHGALLMAPSALARDVREFFFQP